MYAIAYSARLEISHYWVALPQIISTSVFIIFPFKKMEANEIPLLQSNRKTIYKPSAHVVNVYCVF